MITRERVVGVSDTDRWVWLMVWWSDNPKWWMNANSHKVACHQIALVQCNPSQNTKVKVKWLCSCYASFWIRPPKGCTIDFSLIIFEFSSSFTHSCYRFEGILSAFLINFLVWIDLRLIDWLWNLRVLEFNPFEEIACHFDEKWSNEMSWIWQEKTIWRQTRKNRILKNAFFENDWHIFSLLQPQDRSLDLIRW